jgi:lipoate---protein ligase
MSQLWRWIPPLQLDGTSQMALDRWMLDQLAAGAPPMLRLYRWRRPTLSLGRHPRRLEPHWHDLHSSGVIDLVRRPSGGRAVLHAGDLTYALAWQPLRARREQAYAQSCHWLQMLFSQLGLPLQFGTVAALAAQGSPSCFATGTAADLVHANGAKRIGSAQLWRGSFLLQHGTILLNPPQALWRQVFGSDPPALPPLPACPESQPLEERLRCCAERYLCAAPLQEQPLSSEEWLAVMQTKTAPDGAV